ncbi:MAG: helix-turn-helix domain-containing protein [Bacteroidales bacterium]|jgi:transcriptional regulator with XRE-family HTH domain
MIKKTYPHEYYEKLKNIASLIREYRLANGYTQIELAEHLNLHRNTLSRAERGENLTLLTLIELCETLELDMSELFYEEN